MKHSVYVENVKVCVSENKTVTYFAEESVKHLILRS
jgi:hypothetical protein